MHQDGSAGIFQILYGNTVVSDTVAAGMSLYRSVSIQNGPVAIGNKDNLPGNSELTTATALASHWVSLSFNHAKKDDIELPPYPGYIFL